MALAQVAALAANLVRAKLVVLSGGSAALSDYGQISSAVAAITAIATLGSGVGILGARDRRHSVFSSALTWWTVVSAVALCVALLIPTLSAPLALQIGDWLILAAIAGAFSSLAVLVQAFVQSTGRAAAFASARALTSVAFLLALSALLLIQHSEAVRLHFILGGACGFVATLGVATFAKSRPRLQLGTDRQSFTEFASSGMTYMVASTAFAVAMLIAQAILVARGGVEGNASFQAAWIVSLQYVTLLVYPAAVLIQSRFASGATDDGYLDRLIRRVLLLHFVAACSLSVMAPVAIRLLFADGIQAADLLRAQIVADPMRVVTSTLALSLLSLRRMSLYLAAELTWATMFVSVLLLLSGAGAPAVAVSYVLAYGTEFLMLYALFGRRYLTARTLGVLIASTAALGAIGIVAPTILGGPSKQ